MISTQQRTQARIDRVMAHVAFSGWSEQNLAMVRGLIEMALREQDRDTRHACAEAVSHCNDHGSVDDAFITLTRAHSACVNVQAV